MPERETPYKQISLEDAITDAQAKRDISALDKPWQPEKARFRIASWLAFGLLVLFGLTIVCSGTTIAALVITSAVSDAAADNLASGIELMLRFITTLVPYIATPLGIALGYFFREPRSE